MKRFMPLVVITALFTWLAALWLPWWSCGLAAALAMFMLRASRTAAFLAGFLGVFLTWTIWALVLDTQGGGVLGDRMAALFGLPSGWMLAVVSGVVGGLVGALAGLTGKVARDVVSPEGPI